MRKAALVAATAAIIGSVITPAQARVFQPLPVEMLQTKPGVFGAGLYAGVVEGEAYSFTARAGQKVRVSIPHADTALEVIVFPGTGPAFSRLDMVTTSSYRWDEPAEVSFVAKSTGTYTALIVGWATVPGYAWLRPYTGWEERDLYPPFKVWITIGDRRPVVGRLTYERLYATDTFALNGWVTE